MEWQQITPKYGWPYKKLRLGTIAVGRVATPLSGDGYDVYCNLPGLKKEMVGKVTSEGEGMEMLKEVVSNWLKIAHLEEVHNENS